MVVLFFRLEKACGIFSLEDSRSGNLKVNLSDELELTGLIGYGQE